MEEHFPTDGVAVGVDVGGNVSARAASDGSDAKPFLTRLHSASEQRLYLAYRTVRYMVRSHGPDIRKGIHLGLPVWTLIAKELNALSGVEKTPDMWRKTYTSAKYFVHLKFFRYLKTKKIDKRCINWHQFSIKDLLYLQDLRSEGYPDMPNVHLLLKACEEKRNYLTERPPSHPFHSFAQEHTTCNDSLQFSPSGSSESFEPYKEAQLSEEQATQVLNSIGGSMGNFPQMKTDIKTELTQLQYPEMGNNEMDRVYDSYGSLNFPSDTNEPMPSAIVHGYVPNSGGPYGNFSNISQPPMQPHPSQSQQAPSELPMRPQHSQLLPSSSSQQQSAQAAHHTPATAHHPTLSGGTPLRGSQLGCGDHQDWDFEHRLLDVSERMLREKIKQNKLLKRRNRILQKSRKEQRKQTETLNKLLEQLVQRTA